MKKLFFAFLFLPFAISAQNQSAYSISGHITGFPDGTNVSFFDRASGGLDSVGEIRNEKFTIQGSHLPEPDFRFLVFNKQQPVVPILMGNDDVKVSGSSDELHNLNVTGSKVYEEYKELSESFGPLNEVFQTENFTPENVKLIVDVCEKFIESHPDSYVSLLAASQVFQITHNGEVTAKLLDKVGKSQQQTEMAKYLHNQLNAERATAIGAHIMPFSQKDLDGKLVNISDFKGKYVLIDFWASWCRPCRMENPNVVSNYNRYKGKNFTVLGVSLDQSKEAWENAIKMDNLTWTHVSDLKGWQNEVSSKFNVTSIPTNILIDPNGVIIAKNIRGPELGATLEKLLEKK